MLLRGDDETTFELEVRPSDRDTVTIRVYFDLELRPPWASSRSAGERDVWIDLATSRHAVAEAAETLEREAQVYPPRAADLDRSIDSSRDGDGRRR